MPNENDEVVEEMRAHLNEFEKTTTADIERVKRAVGTFTALSAKDVSAGIVFLAQVARHGRQVEM